MTGEIAVPGEYNGNELNFIGTAYTWIARTAAGSMIRDLESGVSIVESMERLAVEFGISTDPEYDSRFLELLEQKQGREPSFIFCSDHKYTVEPFLYGISFPQVIRDKIVEYDREHPKLSLLHAVGSDMVSRAIPQFSKYIDAVVLRDADGQFLTCPPEFVKWRRDNRTEGNEEALDVAARRLLEPGNVLIIAPSGFVHALEWKRGMARIMGKVAEVGRNVPEGTPNPAEHTYVVPVSCNGLRPREFGKFFARAGLAKLGQIHRIPERLYSVTFGAPINVAEFMVDMLPPEADIDAQKQYMLVKTREIQKQYYKWVAALPQMKEI